LWNADPIAFAQRRKIYYENPHTDGYRYKCLWGRTRSSYPHINLYYFITGYKLRKGIFKEILSGKKYT